MDIRAITDAYAVSPQIEPGDMAALAAEGFTAVICNRPDPEVPPELGRDAMERAARRAGLTFVYNPVAGGAPGMEAVAAQSAVLASGGKVFAYCTSGTRSCILWALAQAELLPVDEIIEAAGRAGYAIQGLRPQIEVLRRHD
ncbi:MAG: TIGR01244 family sulfur transferase [Pseudomonadota bacterium]